MADAIDLLTIETSLGSGLKVVKSQRKSFKEGYISDSVIDGFLFSIQKRHRAFLFLSTSSVQCIQSGHQIGGIWRRSLVKFDEAKFVFVPYNPSGCHWILIVADLNAKQIRLLDPKVDLYDGGQVRNFNGKLAKFLSSKLTSHGNFQQYPFVVSKDHSIQSDANSCGALICHYAEQIIVGNAVTRKVSPVALRRRLSAVVVGNCCVNAREHSHCPKCKRKDDASESWIGCDVCHQWHHLKCLGLDENAKSSFFRC